MDRRIQRIPAEQGVRLRERRAEQSEGRKAVEQLLHLLLQQIASLHQPRIRQRNHQNEPTPRNRVNPCGRRHENVPNNRGAAEAGRDTMREGKREKGVPVLLPYRIAKERHPEDEMERGSAAGRIHENHLQAEEDQGTGIPRHYTTGCRADGRTGQTDRQRVRGLRITQPDKRVHQAMGAACRNPEGDNIPLRTPHVRNHDAGHRNGHLHREQAARTPRVEHDPDLRKGHGQEQAKCGRSNPQYIQKEGLSRVLPRVPSFFRSEGNIPPRKDNRL